IKYGTGFNIFFRICWFMGFLIALGYILGIIFLFTLSGKFIATLPVVLALIFQVRVLYFALQRIDSAGQIISKLIGSTLTILFLLTGGCIIIF
ncbi:MAG: hypothetical protein KAG10_02040, partial [Methylococcales bacterium]|nr:hypothetical protein [Methylococcales bacterium]